jgi:tetratricopeptide (TPR) repeat protein
MGKHEEALHELRRALRIQTSALGAEHPDVAWTLYNVGRALYRKGEPGGALVDLRRALTLATARLDHRQLVWLHAAIGYALHAKGDHLEALGELREALAASMKEHPPRDPRDPVTGMAAAMMSVCAAELGRAEESREAAQLVSAAARPVDGAVTLGRDEEVLSALADLTRVVADGARASADDVASIHRARATLHRWNEADFVRVADRWLTLNDGDVDRE